MVYQLWHPWFHHPAEKSLAEFFDRLQVNVSSVSAQIQFLGVGSAEVVGSFEMSELGESSAGVGRESEGAIVEGTGRLARENENIKVYLGFMREDKVRLEEQSFGDRQRQPQVPSGGG